jgi:hypothetical protein
MALVNPLKVIDLSEDIDLSGFKPIGVQGRTVWVCAPVIPFTGW